MTKQRKNKILFRGTKLHVNLQNLNPFASKVGKMAQNNEWNRYNMENFRKHHQRIHLMQKIEF
jgi:ribosomal protein S2